MFSDSAAANIPVESSAGGECEGRGDDCASGVYDCAGECDGDAVIDCAGTCDGDALVDCAGECNGSAVEDVCGECNGSETDVNNCFDSNELFVHSFKCNAFSSKITCSSLR